MASNFFKIISLERKEQKLIFEKGCYGARYNKLKLVQTALLQGCNVNQFTKIKQTMLHFAVDGKNKEIVNFLLQNGANPKMHIHWNNSYLNRLADQTEVPMDIARLLIAKMKGCEIDIGDSKGWRPLHYCARYGHSEFAKFLLESGANPNIRNVHSQTPLHIALTSKHLNILEILVDYGARLDVKDKFLCSPLKELVDKYPDLLRHLIKKLRGLPNLPLDICSDRNQIVGRNEWKRQKCKWIFRSSLDYEQRKWIFENGCYGARHNELRLVEMALRDGCDVNQRTKANKTMLHLALEGKNQGIVNFLLENGANPIMHRYFNNSHLNRLADHKEVPIDIARLLIAKLKGSEIDTGDSKGWRPLHYCAKYGHLEFAKLLLDSGANPNIQNIHNQTPVHFSLTYKHINILKILVDYGARLDVKDKFSYSPLNDLSDKYPDVLSLYKKKYHIKLFHIKE